jgi:hypothetical protein
VHGCFFFGVEVARRSNCQILESCIDMELGDTSDESKASEYFNSRLLWTLESCDSTLDGSMTHLNDLNLERLTRTVIRRRGKNWNS